MNDPDFLDFEQFKPIAAASMAKKHTDYDDFFR
jgi:hypothetical protein